MTHSKLKHNTNIPNRYHDAFLKEVCFSLERSKKVCLNKLNKKRILFKRKHYLNKRFEFTDEAILVFEGLSHKLTTMQNDIIEKYKALLLKLENEILSNGGHFTDYNIKLNIQFLCHAISDDIDVLFESEHILSGDINDEHNMELINKNYAGYECLNEYKMQFSHFHQSRLFHHLLMESHLALQDILLLDEIWFDITVDYQMMHSLK